MTLSESQCIHGPGIGIRGLMVFGRATAPVGFEARVVAVLLCSNFIPECLAGVRARLAEFRASRRDAPEPLADAPEAFADARAPFAGFPATFADARDARGEMPFSTIHTLQLTT